MQASVYNSSGAAADGSPDNIIQNHLTIQGSRTPRHSHLSPDLHVAGDLAYLAAATLVSVTILSPGL